jgi:hypothetical protein
MLCFGFFQVEIVTLKPICLTTRDLPATLFMSDWWGCQKAARRVVLTVSVLTIRLAFSRRFLGVHVSLAGLVRGLCHQVWLTHDISVPGTEREGHADCMLRTRCCDAMPEGSIRVSLTLRAPTATRVLFIS